MSTHAFKNIHRLNSHLAGLGALQASRVARAARAVIGAHTFRMQLASLCVLSCSTAANADGLFMVSKGLVVWNGGMASNIGGGSWVGTGWDRFPGVSPPWNPVARPIEIAAPEAVMPVVPVGPVVPMPSPRMVWGAAMQQPVIVVNVVQAAPAPAPVRSRPISLFIAGETVTVMALP